MEPIFIGVDYGRKESFAAIMSKNEDGSWTLHDIITGKGLDDIDPTINKVPA